MGKIYRQRPLAQSQMDTILARSLGKPVKMVSEVKATTHLTQPFRSWEDLNYWNSGEWQVVQERLDDMDKNKLTQKDKEPGIFFDHSCVYNPRRELLFAALDATPFDKVKVAIYGQDPYPNRLMACGLAFSIPNGTIGKGYQNPPTFDSILDEYCNDLHYSRPNTTSLLNWANQGVLLWNSIPSCQCEKSMSHDWDEWKPLTEEITKRLSDKADIVFVFMGGVARRNVKYVNQEHNTVIETAHPVVDSRYKRRTVFMPFRGSRVFSRVNDALAHKHGSHPIDWKL